MDRFTAIQAFARAISTGSFSAAARKMDRTPAAVSKQIAELEDWLGAKLFMRTTRRLSLTEAGRNFQQRAERILEELEGAKAEAGSLQHSPRGLLRVSAPISFGILHLHPMLDAFLAANPEIRMSVELTDRHVDLIDEGFDMAIRIGNLPDSTLIAKRLATSSFVLCAAPSYIERWHAPRVPGDLRAHDCLVYEYGSAAWSFEGPQGRETVSVKGRFSSNNGLLMLDLAIAGHGIAYGPRFILDRAISDGRLIKLMPEYKATETGIYAIHPSGRYAPIKVQRFIEHLVSEI